MFLNFLFVLISLITALGGLAPTAMAIDRAMTARKAGSRFWPWICISLLSITMLAVGAFLSMVGLFVGVFPSFIFTLNGGNLLPVVLASLLTLAAPWAVWLLGKRWIEKKEAV